MIQHICRTLDNFQEQYSRENSVVKARGGLVMRTHDGYDAWDSYEQAEDAIGENVRNGNDDIESNGRRFQGTPFEVATTMRSLIKAQEEKHQLNAAMFRV